MIIIAPCTPYGVPASFKYSMCISALILTRSHDINERMNECMNQLKNERILDRSCEA